MTSRNLKKTEIIRMKKIKRCELEIFQDNASKKPDSFPINHKK